MITEYKSNNGINYIIDISDISENICIFSEDEDSIGMDYKTSVTINMIRNNNYLWDQLFRGDGWVLPIDLKEYMEKYIKLKGFW